MVLLFSFLCFVLLHSIAAVRRHLASLRSRDLAGFAPGDGRGGGPYSQSRTTDWLLKAVQGTGRVYGSGLGDWEATVMSAEARLKALEINLPKLPPAAGNYVPGTLHNGVLYLSGQGPLLADGSFARGTVGIDVTIEEAHGHARRTGLVLLSAARLILGSLDRVERVLSVFGMVNAAPGFGDHPKVINGCSDLFVEVFGENGRHARAAVGMGSLPLNIPVEITAILAVKP